VELQRVDVVLVRPARPANVAAACRALKNMGLASLVLVDPPPGLDDPAARALAYGAWDLLDAARRRESLEDAVAAATFVVGTTGRPATGDWTPRRLGAEAAARADGGRLALVFGPESAGLTNRELALCHARVHVPCDPQHPSLNLAQAVLIVAYELRLSWLGRGGGETAGAGTAASTGEIEGALRDLRAGLLAVGYLNPANPEAVLAELRALLVRARPTPREVNLLRGLARQITWAGTRIARSSSGTDNPSPFRGGHE
jgi:TrmH family RNA methyltransferase